MRRTLFLNPPSFAGFDGGAGARYQARREIRSFWYPTWLAQSAALVPDSRLVDAPPRGMTREDVVALADDFELAVLYTSTPSLGADLRVAEALKEANPRLIAGLVGPPVVTSPAQALGASGAIDFVAGNEFELTIQEIAAGRPLAQVDGISYRAHGQIVRNRPRAVLEDMDRLPHVVDVYRRDLVIEDYYVGELLHPYVSFYTGRGCKSRCTFCLWPQTIGGHRYRTRSVEDVVAEVAKVQRYFPQVKEVMFDDDTLTDDLAHAEGVARGMGELGMTWSCNAKANVPYQTLKVLRANGLRMMVVGYESGNQQILHNIKKGMRVERARQFSADCHELGIALHGTFVVGLPGETAQTIQETIRFAKEVNPHTIQVALAAAYPGTALHEQARREGWLREAAADGGLVGDGGMQVSSLAYPHLSHGEIFDAVAEFYRRFYLRPSKVLEITREMVRDGAMLRRRLREAGEFFRFLAARADRP
jgi:hopanoid biosynthesis associated radical SAM protein HpnJ